MKKTHLNHNRSFYVIFKKTGVFLQKRNSTQIKKNNASESILERLKFLTFLIRKVLIRFLFILISFFLIFFLILVIS